MLSSIFDIVIYNIAIKTELMCLADIKKERAETPSLK